MYPNNITNKINYKTRQSRCSNVYIVYNIRHNNIIKNKFFNNYLNFCSVP